MVAALVAALMAVPMAATAKDGGQHKFTADLSGAAVEFPPWAGHPDNGR